MMSCIVVIGCGVVQIVLKICHIATTSDWKEGCVFDVCFAKPKHATQISV